MARPARSSTRCAGCISSCTISAKNFSPYWKEVFLPHISFELNQGETLVIHGSSGVGKSTLAAALFGFAPYKGSLTIGGAEISSIDGVDGPGHGSGLSTNTILHQHVLDALRVK